MCSAQLAGGPLVCIRTDAHLTGHVYESTSAVTSQEKADGGGGDE